MIHIYFGDGKGKTSAINGSAIRAQGAQLRPLVIRFLKGRETSEDAVLAIAGIPIEKFHYGDKFVFQMSEQEKVGTLKAITEGMNWIKVNAHRFDVIILDEFLDLAAHNVALLSEKQMIGFINEIKTDREILISGHTVLKELFSEADLITEFRSLKHYFSKGQRARKGIEY